MLEPQTEISQDVMRGQVQAGMEDAAVMLTRFLSPGNRFSMDFSTDRQRGDEGKGEEDLTGICLEISGAITGSIVLLLSVENACRLAGLLLRRSLPPSTDDEALRSTLREVGNIFASGVLGSLDDGLKLRALPSPPVCLTGSRAQIQDQCRQCLGRPLGLQVEAGLNCKVGEEAPIRSEVLFRLVEEQLPA